MTKKETLDFALWFIENYNTEQLDWKDAERMVNEYENQRIDVDVYHLKSDLESIANKFSVSGADIQFTIKIPQYEKDEKRKYLYITIVLGEPIEVEYFDYENWMQDIKAEIINVLKNHNLELSVPPLILSGETEVVISEDK